MGALQDLLGVGASQDEDMQVPDDASTLTGGAGEGPEPEDGLAPDPRPSRRTKRNRRAPAARARVGKAESDQVRDALTMLYTLPAWGAKLKDPHCGGALLDQRDDIVKALVPIVCRNPAMLAFFTAANAPWMDYLALAQALLPVGQTIWAHHVTHTVGATEDAGEVPVDLSHYSAPRFG